jgi:hypothetical protein
MHARGPVLFQALQKLPRNEWSTLAFTVQKCLADAENLVLTGPARWLLSPSMFRIRDGQRVIEE